MRSEYSLRSTNSHNLQRSKPSIDGLQVVCSNVGRRLYSEIATDGAQGVMRFCIGYQGPQITPVVLSIALEP